MLTGSIPSNIVTYAGPAGRSSAIARSVFRVDRATTDFPEYALARGDEPPDARSWNAGAVEHGGPRPAKFS
ncbi:hypothetical protein [Sorangium sp. So ce693]|uniref:hypothetical protein n=1 Tax=Sorangium sp. So ce693 TaxID=3133318 RepID=UPI003F5EE299